MIINTKDSMIKTVYIASTPSNSVLFTSLTIGLSAGQVFQQTMPTTSIGFVITFSGFTPTTAQFYVSQNNVPLFNGNMNIVTVQGVIQPFFATLSLPQNYAGRLVLTATVNRASGNSVVASTPFAIIPPPPLTPVQCNTCYDYDCRKSKGLPCESKSKKSTLSTKCF